MRYALLIHVDEKLTASLNEAEQGSMMAEYMAFGERYKDKIVGGDPLLPVAMATTVRVRDGKTMTTDGPFAETKEQLNGFYLVSCDNLDEAVEMAAQIPDAVGGCVEVRPVMEFSEA
ncbi:MAG: YciI family protein [Herpetosiphonaceae bacterium]|nr:YciI family protein [Herpetosiphonaceae bacterium]